MKFLVPGIDSISRNHFLCLSVRTAPHLLKFYLEICSNSVISSDFTSNFSFFNISITSAVTSSTEVLPPSKSPMRTRINFFQTPVYGGILTFSHESQMFLMASRMVNPFQRFSIDFAQIHQRNHYLWQLLYNLMKCIIRIKCLERQNYSLIRPLQSEYCVGRHENIIKSFCIFIRALG